MQQQGNTKRKPQTAQTQITTMPAMPAEEATPPPPKPISIIAPPTPSESVVASAVTVSEAASMAGPSSAAPPANESQSKDRTVLDKRGSVHSVASVVSEAASMTASSLPVPPANKSQSNDRTTDDDDDDGDDASNMQEVQDDEISRLSSGSVVAKPSIETVNAIVNAVLREKENIKAAGGAGSSTGEVDIASIASKEVDKFYGVDEGKVDKGMSEVYEEYNRHVPTVAAAKKPQARAHPWSQAESTRSLFGSFTGAPWRKTESNRDLLSSITEPIRRDNDSSSSLFDSFTKLTRRNNDDSNSSIFDSFTKLTRKNTNDEQSSRQNRPSKRSDNKSRRSKKRRGNKSKIKPVIGSNNSESPDRMEKGEKDSNDAAIDWGSKNQIGKIVEGIDNDPTIDWSRKSHIGEIVEGDEESTDADSALSQDQQCNLRPWRQLIIIFPLIGLIVATASTAIAFAVVNSDLRKTPNNVAAGNGAREQQLLETAERVVAACSESKLGEDRKGCQKLCHAKMCCFESGEHSCGEDDNKECAVYAGCEAMKAKSR